MRFLLIKDFKFIRDIYQLNNSLHVRLNSINKKKFSYKSHEMWLKEMIISKTNKAFVLLDKKKFIGFIKYENVQKKNFLSWAIKNKFRNKGYGKKILKLLIRKFPKKYHAKIKKKNIYSLKMCMSNGFNIYFRNKKFFFLKN